MIGTGFEERLKGALAATHAVIDLDAYAANLAALRSRLSAGAGLVAVVKANAYGHGMLPCARAALESGAAWLAVARVEEGLLLRQAGITAPILVLGPPNPARAGAAVAADLALTVGSFAAARAIAAAAGALNRPARLHLKLETGLHRYGIDAHAALDLAREIAGDPRLRLDGLYSHLATADEADDGFLREQERRFVAGWRALLDAGLAPPYVHLANSAATLRGVIPALDGRATPLARTGIASYGLSPSPEVPVPADFRPVLTLKTRLGRVFTLPAGEGVSYGRTFIADRPLRMATVPIGYGDGLPRLLSNRGWAVVRGVVCPIRGRVCMDQTVIEVEAVPDAAEGDEALVYSAGDAGMSVDRVAQLCGTINYEIVTALSARLPRVYLRGGRPVAVSDLLGLAEAEP